MNTLKKQSAGFTLVEIAIVIVIAGFLIGGVLKGQELVVQARAKNLLNDFNGVAYSVLAYRDRYNVMPGDDGMANPRWGSFGAVSGNGNGTVEGNYHDLPPPAGPLTETLIFWSHLRISGFVFGATSGPNAVAVPITAVGGILGVQTGSAVANFFPGLIACANDVPDRIAQTVDAQLDDQRPQAGFIRSVQQKTSGGAPLALTAANTTVTPDYVENGSRYIVCRQL